jgi:hypothetical protein
LEPDGAVARSFPVDALYFRKSIAVEIGKAYVDRIIVLFVPQVRNVGRNNRIIVLFVPQVRNVGRNNRIIVLFVP